jgi:8-oxo-dGTP pyrophosphatase MutT (NUDIX family)
MGTGVADLGADAREPVARTSGRVLLLDREDRVLLLRGSDPVDPAAGDWWFTPGGGLDSGESAEQGARRELREETGLDLADVGPPVWIRTAEFSFLGRRYRQAETFFLARVDSHVVDFSGHTDIERDAVHEFRWWSLDELERSRVTVYPTTLAAELRTLLAQVRDFGPPDSPKDVGP